MSKLLLLCVKVGDTLVHKCYVIKFIVSLISPILKFWHRTTAQLWCSGYSTSINACGVWGVKTGVQISKKELHTHIYLDYVRVEILSCIKKKKKNLT